MKVLRCKKAAGLFLFIFLMPINLFAANSADVIDAINKGDLSRMKELVSEGLDVNAKDAAVSPLIYASIRGQREIAAFLISRGADVNVKDDLDGAFGGRTSLMHATLNGYREIVDLLISKGADINTMSRGEKCTALRYALWNGKKEIALLLILRGADINAKDNLGNTPLIYALRWDQLEIAKLLISSGAGVNVEDNQGDTPLIAASSEGKKESMEMLVANGADINHKNHNGETPLLVALRNGHKEAADFLLAKGAVADVDAKGPEGGTSLMQVAQFGKRDAAESLIRKGANVNARDYDGKTPLMFTVTHGKRNEVPDSQGNIPPEYYTKLAGREQIAELLILKGADVNAKDYDGRTPLIYAVMNGLKEIAALLISKGALVDAEDDQGNTPLTYALRNKDDEIERLIKAGLKVSRLAKRTAESHMPVEVDEELHVAKETLINFFDYLRDGQYDKAVLLFEPWEEGMGIHHSSWEGFFSFLLQEERNEKGKPKALGIVYTSVGTPIRVNVLDIRKSDKNVYRSKVQFVKNDGTIYTYGPCCGATEDSMPSQTEFVYFVERIDGVYKVRTPPLFRP